MAVLNLWSMEEQRSALENYFIKWKGDHEQVDDMLLIGFRL